MIALLIVCYLILNGCVYFRASLANNPDNRSSSAIQEVNRSQIVEPQMHRLPKGIPQLIGWPNLANPTNIEKPKLIGREVKKIERKFAPDAKDAVVQSENKTTGSNSLSMPASPKMVNMLIERIALQIKLAGLGFILLLDL